MHSHMGNAASSSQWKRRGPGVRSLERCLACTLLQEVCVQVIMAWLAYYLGQHVSQDLGTIALASSTFMNDSFTLSCTLIKTVLDVFSVTLSEDGAQGHGVI